MSRDDLLVFLIAAAALGGLALSARRTGPQAGAGPSFAPTIARPGKWFAWEELYSDEPTPAVARNLLALVANTLDPLRERLGRPVIVTSGYRTHDHNQDVGGDSHSQHLTGHAVDILVTGMSSQQLAQAVAAYVPFDKLIFYAPSRGGHVHVSYVTGGNRRAILYAPPTGGYQEARA